MPPDAVGRGPRAFRAMGCGVHVAGATAGELARIERLFAERERRFSRFRSDSELTRVNTSPLPVQQVSDEFARMTALAMRAAAASGGLVDPTLGRAIVAAGYDRDFASMSDLERRPGAATAGRLREVALWGRWLARPPGLELDLNGVVKAATVDDALELIAGDGWVSAGGDLAVNGETVVSLPRGGALMIRNGGVATSGSERRRWRAGGAVQHHLIDPASGLPSTSPWLLVTVAAASCSAADVAAKTAFLLRPRGLRWLDRSALPGRFVGANGEVVVNNTWLAIVGPDGSQQAAAAKSQPTLGPALQSSEAAAVPSEVSSHATQGGAR